MYFEWDEAKATSNKRKHDVDFQEATEVFADSHASCVPDPDHSLSEERLLLFGISSKARFLVVSFTERSDSIRIISARLMTSSERKAYEQ